MILKDVEYLLRGHYECLLHNCTIFTLTLRYAVSDMAIRQYGLMSFKFDFYRVRVLVSGMIRYGPCSIPAEEKKESEENRLFFLP